MRLEIDNQNHCEDFVRLNEAWISEYFSIEEADRKLAADPFRVVRDGGHILSLTENGRVVGVCALIKEADDRYQLARMAVDAANRGKGYGGELLKAALTVLRKRRAKSVYLLSNTVLAPAIGLYRKHGFRTISEEPHPDYDRCNIVMEKLLQ